MVQVNRQKCRKHGIGKPNHFDQPLFSVSNVLGSYKYGVFFELLLRIFLSKILRRFISVNPARKSPTPFGVGLFLVVDGFERRLLASVQWTLATNLASPQRRESALPVSFQLQHPAVLGLFYFQFVVEFLNVSCYAFSINLPVSPEKEEPHE